MRKVSRNEQYLQNVLAGTEPAPFNLSFLEPPVETYAGTPVKLTRARIPLSTTVLDVCPICFSEKSGGGVLIDGVCSNGCLAIKGSLETVGVRVEKGPRKSLNWKTKDFDGQSLTQIATQMRAEGQTLPAIAAVLTEMVGRRIVPANVCCHVKP